MRSYIKKFILFSSYGLPKLYIKVDIFAKKILFKKTLEAVSLEMICLYIVVRISEHNKTKFLVTISQRRSGFFFKSCLLHF